MPQRRRRLALLLVLLLVVFAFVRLPLWSAGIVERRASAFFHRPVSVGSVRYHLLPFQAEIRDLRVAGPAPGDPAFLEVPRVLADVSLTQLWDRHLVLNQLRVEGLRVRVHAYPKGGDDIPKLGSGKGGEEVKIRRLVIEGGEVWVDHDRVPLDLDVPEFHGRLSERRPGVLAGRIALGPGPARFGSGPALPVATEASIALEGKVLTVESAKLTSSGTDLDYRGRIRLSPLGADLAVAGAVDLAITDRHVLRSGFGLEGAGRFQGTVGIDAGKLRIRGHLTGDRGRFDGVSVPRYDGEVAWDEGGVHLRGLEATLMDGRGRFDVEVPPGQARARVKAFLEGVDGEAAVRYLFHVGEARLGAAVTGNVDVSWPRGRAAALSGTADLAFAPLADGRTPLSGRFRWRATDGEQTLEDALLTTPAAEARLSGTVTADRHTDLAVDARTTDLAAADELLVRVRRALGTAEAQPVGLGGSGVFQGRWRGRFDDPVFEGRIVAQDVSYLGVVWGRAEAAGRLDSREVRPHSLVLRRGGAEMWIDGRAQTGFYGEDDDLDVRVRLDKWPASDLAQALRSDIRVSGPISGEATIAGSRSRPTGGAHVTSASGTYYGVPFEALDVRSVLRGRVTELTEGRALVGGGSVTFAGTVTDDGIYDGRAEALGLEVGALFPDLAPELRWGGRLSGHALLQGTLSRPRLVADLSSPRLFLGDEGVGALEARMVGSGDGMIAVDARCRSPRLNLTAAGRVGLATPHASDLTVTARETSLDPFLRAVAPSLPASLAVVATGELGIHGPLLDPAKVAVDAAFDTLQVGLPEYPVRNQGRVEVRVAEGRLDVRRLALAGEGTDLAVTGHAGLVPGGEVDLAVRGSADLRALSLVGRDLRGHGAARVAVSVTGTRAAPVVDGALDVDGGGVRLRGFPHGVDDLHGRIQFTRAGAHFSGMTGTIGGGPVELEGQAAYKGGHLVSFDVQASGHGLSLRYPEGLKSVLDADLRLLGDESQQWLTGRVDVRQAIWTKRYDVATELLAISSATPESGTLGSSLRYDIKVEAPGTLKIDNNLASLQARADVSLQGTYAAPVMLGRAEIDHGRVFFQGTTYQIRRGSIDFANPAKLDPYFDIEAEARVRAYLVTLKMNGTLEHVYPTLTSDPPLTTVGILSLLAGGDDSQLQLAANKQSGELAKAGAVTLAAGKISEQVGLERGAARLGLSRFSIDPSVVRGEIGNLKPTARMTLGKRITPDLDVVYSQDLGGAEDRLFSVEYTLSDKLSLVLTREEHLGGAGQDYGFDLRLRKSR